MHERAEIIGIIETTETIATTVTAEMSRAAESIESMLQTSTLQMVEICQETCQQSPGRRRSNRGARSSKSLGNLENLEYEW